MHFSHRLPHTFASTRLSRELDQRPDLFDLTESNPTRCGLIFPQESLCAILGRMDPGTYDPQPLGWAPAREAVVQYVAQSTPTSLDRIVLTSGTSEGYAFLLKILCNPGDTVAVPAPGYPLLDVLLDLESVRRATYRLQYEGRWHVDWDSLLQVLRSGVRAVVAVHPNNPTGRFLWGDEVARFRELCAEHRVVILSDEVFAAFGSRGQRVATLGEDDGAPVVVLDGLSKSMGLPQLKIAWLRMSGPAPWREGLRARLEWVADAFLSLPSWTQQAVPELLSEAPLMQQRIGSRLAVNRATLEGAINEVPGLALLAGDGGWHAILRVPRVMTDDDLVLALADRARVLVHPGYFYEFLAEGYLVLSLLGDPVSFREAAAALARALNDLLW